MIFSSNWIKTKTFKLTFANISQNPLFKIDKNNKVNNLIKIDKPIKELDCLIVQIKDTNTNEDIEFHDFNGDDYSFELSFDCDKNWKRKYIIKRLIYI